jgi:putative phosphoesterase
MRVMALADTHLRRGGKRRLPDPVYDALADVGVVLHAGDVVDRDLLDELSGFAPVHAVLGNNDHDLVGVLPESRLVELEGVRVGLVHDPGPRAGRHARLNRRFPDAAVVLFGHTHEPCAERGVGGQLLFNPGSPTQRRRQPDHTFGLLELRAGRVTSHRIVRA